MQQWEYKVCQHDIKGWTISEKKLEDWLNKLGSEGWQMVNYESSTGRFYFKRLKK